MERKGMDGEMKVRNSVITLKLKNIKETFEKRYEYILRNTPSFTDKKTVCSLQIMKSN